VLVGRDIELERIDQLLALVRSGAGVVVAVEGPAGIGKTALLREAAARARSSGFRVLRAGGGQLEQEFAFGVVRRLFAPPLAEGGSAELLAGAAGLASGPLGVVAAAARPAVGVEDRTAAAMHGLFWLTVNLADRGPLVLVIDDAHWADAMSLRFAVYLARRVEDVPVLVLLATRPGSEHGTPEIIGQLAVLPGLVLLRPAPLNEPEVARVLEQTGLPGAGQQVAVACQQASGGNPFLLGELVAALAAECASGRTIDAVRVAGLVPGSIVPWVLARLVALGEDAKRLAFAFAVLGPGSTLADVALLAELDPRRAAVVADALIAANILSAEQWYEFAHPLVQAAVYEGLAPAQRAGAHSRAARLMADGGAPLARVAAHLLAADPAHDTWAIEVLRAAAREASATGAPRSTVSYLERAVKEKPPRAIRAELLAELGEAQLQAGMPDAARRLREALDLHVDPRRRAEISLTLGRALFSVGSFPAARQAVRAGLAGLPEGNDDLLLEPWAWFIRDAQGEWGLPTVAAARLRRLLGNNAPPRTRTERVLLVYLGYVHGVAGDRPRAEVAGLIYRALEDGALLEDGGGDLMPFGAACETLLCVGEPASAAAALDLAITASQLRGWRVAFGLFSAIRGIAHYMRGDLLHALADLESASIVQAEEYALWLPATRAYLALCLIERDDLAAAADTLALPGGEDRWAAQPSFISYLYALGRLRAIQGKLREGLETLLTCEHRVREMRAPNPAANLPWRSDAAILSACLGERDQARELVAQELTLARAFGAPHALGTALRASGLIESGDVGVDRFAEAVAVLDQSGIDLELARALTDYGAALRRAGQRRDAREPLRRALDLATRCGAPMLAVRAREELIAAGARPRRGRVRGADALTASELRIARMAANGMTNREIAQALFITIRTVTTHLGHVYQKLEISGREQLAHALQADAGTMVATTWAIRRVTAAAC
jgi:DNA-binding CsgD family transcriptional regulator